VNQGQRAGRAPAARHRAGALVAGALGALALSAAALVPGAAAAAAPWFSLHQEAPHLPAGTAALGTAAPAQVLHLDVVLAGRDDAALAQAVAAVSTPGSPQYRQYLSASQFAAQFGPAPAEVAQVSATLRGEGLTVGDVLPGSALLSVRGTAAAVSAAFGTPLEAVQAPGRSRAVVNTASPQVPAALSGVVTGVVGLDGLFKEHAMLMPRSGAGSAPGTPSATAGGAGAAGRPDDLVAHASVPQACAPAQADATGGSYTSTELAGIFGLDQLFAQGRTGVGQSIAVVEFEQYYASDLATFQSCYGLSNPVRNVVVDGPVGGSPEGSGEAALDTELAAFNAPSASLVVYQAPNQGDTDALDVFNRIASDDSSQVVTTSWGQCEAEIPSGDLQAEDTIFERMALQGQTVVAASGDAGSEDCYPQFSSLGVDDPGAQPDVVGVGGTTMTSAAAASQVVWNDCQGQPSSSGCAAESFTGSGGGGYSSQWAANPGQPAASGTGTDPCSPKPACRAVPDLSYPSNPDAGGVVAYSSGQGGWARFGGTSVGAPTNAALFADVNQGCASPVGRVGPALYAAASSTTFTDIGSGNNDFTGTNGGLFAAVSGSGVSGYDPASGLGSPVDQNLAAALQGGSGCPSVSAVVPDTGPVDAGGPVTVEGGGLAGATSVTFGPAGAGSIVARSAGSLTVVPPDAGAPMCVDVTVTTPLGTSAASGADRYGFGGDLDCGDGYRFAASDGGVFSFGGAGFYGSMGGTALVAPVVGLASTPSTHGYWEVASDGGIFSFGDAQFFGSMGGQRLNRPIVAMAATPDGGGYWEVASDGGIFSFGDAQFFGSMGGQRLNRPIVGMAATPDGGGYWEVASDGGIFAFGDAQFYGSTGGLRLNQPVVGMAAAPGGSGYWLVAADGGIFDYGSAGFFGSAGSLRLNKPVVGMAATPDGGGYWEVASDGGIFAYGDAQFYGSTGNLTLNRPIVGMTST